MQADEDRALLEGMRSIVSDQWDCYLLGKIRLMAWELDCDLEPRRALCRIDNDPFPVWLDVADLKTILAEIKP